MKNKSSAAKSTGSNSTSAVSVRPNPVAPRSRIPSEEEISARARQIWQDRGRPSDRDLEIWVEAERELSQSSSNRSSSGLPVTRDTEEDVQEAEKVQERIDETAAPAPDRSPTSL